MIDLNISIENLRMVGPMMAKKLEKLDIRTINDLLMHLPSRYENYSIFSKIINVQPEEIVSVVGTISSFNNIYTKTGKKIQKLVFYDETGEMEAVFYNQPFLGRFFKKNTDIILAGKVSLFGNKKIFESPQYELVKDNTVPIHSGRIVPIYPETEGVSSKFLRSRIFSILTKFSPHFQEIIPGTIKNKYGLLDKRRAILNVHFPENLLSAQKGRETLEFEELLSFLVSLKYVQMKIPKEKIKKIISVGKFKNLIDYYINQLPFKLTSDQTFAVNEILKDLEKNMLMNRLLEGDVGSGKTVVAAIAIYVVFLNGLKSLFMAPTTILVEQHYQTIKELFKNILLKIGILTSQTKKYKKCDLIIGTHALLSEKIDFTDIGLIVIDEQQRFGVEQRRILREKGGIAHLLTMTATPIPRTIALTLYSDLNLSVLEDMPKGRILVKTWVVPNEKRIAAYNWMKKLLSDKNNKQQAFIICPLIEESENLETVRAVKAEFKKLKNDIFSEFKIELLHGRMKNDEKNKTLKKFSEGKTDILVATPVVEVGIDIPNATVILIEAAERFGLAQLHQLRGRVGRSDKQAYCLLFTESDSEKIIGRLKYLEKIYSGPRLAEIDLKLRGSGELLGTRQHGFVRDLKIADLNNISMLKQVRWEVDQLLSLDPNLVNHPHLRKIVQNYKIKSSLLD